MEVTAKTFAFYNVENDSRHCKRLLHIIRVKFTFGSFNVSIAQVSNFILILNVSYDFIYF